MELIFQIGVPGVPLLVLIALAFGIRLLRRSRAQKQPERRQALEWAGGSLIEPLINTFLVFMLMQLFVPHHLDSLHEDKPAWNLLPQTLLITLPILFLLKPVKGWNSPDAPSRNLNRALVVMGLLRWAITVFGLIYLPIIAFGMVVLGISIIVVVEQAAVVVKPDRMADLAIGAGPEGIKVAPADEFEAGDEARALL